MKKTKKVLAVFLTALMAAALVGCAQEPAGGTNEPNGGSSEPATDSVVIGHIGPHDGDLSVYGLAVKNGATMAIQEVKQVLGRDIEMISYDSKGDGTEAVNAYNKLIDQDGAVAIIGGVVSGESTAIGSASQGIGTPILSPSATAAEFSLTGSNVFRGCYTDPIQATQIAKFVAEDLGATTAAIIYNTGDAYSDGVRQVFTDEFTAAGGEVVASEGYAAGDNDFKTQLTKIAQLDIDVLFVPNYYEDVALIAKQAKELGIDATLVGGDGWDGVLSVTDDASVLEGAIFANHYSIEDPAIQEFTTSYTDQFGTAPNAFAYLAYDSTKAMLQAIEDAGNTDSEAIVKALAGISYDGILGNMQFDENGDPIKDVAFVTIKDGKYVTYGK